MSGPFPHSVSTFVGRRAELDRALSLFDSETLFVFYGPAGIGKSELVYRLVEEVNARGGKPFGTIAVAGRGGDVLASLGGALGTDAELGAIAGALEAAPVLVFLDDAHTFDSDALANALSYLARHVRTSVLLVASRRRIPLPADGPGAVILELPTVSPADTATLTVSLAQRRGTAAPDPAELHDQTGGNPGLIQRAIAARRDERGLFDDTFAELEALPSRLLLLASVVGDALGFKDIEAHLGATRADLDDAARALADRFLIERHGDVVRARPMVVAAAQSHASEAELGETQRVAAQLHSVRFLADPNRPVEALAAVKQLVDSGDLAGAWALIEQSHGQLAIAGLDHEIIEHVPALREALPDRALAISMLHARVLLRMGRPSLARRVLDEAPVATTPDDRVTFLGIDAACSARLGQVSAATETLARAAELAPTPELGFQVAMFAADVKSLRGLGDEARAGIEAARAAHPKATDAERARAEFSVALSYFTQERFAQAAAALRRAVPGLSAEDLGDLGGALALIEVMTRIEHDDVRTARSLVETVLAGASRSSERAGQLAMLRGLTGEYLGRAMLALGELDGATEILARAAATATAAGMELASLRGRTHHASGLAVTGKVASARRRIEATLAAPELTAHSRTVALHVKALTHALEGSIGAARRALDELAGDDDGIVAAPLAAAADLARAEIEMYDGDPEVGIECARRARHYYGECGRQWLEARAALALAACYVARGGDAGLVGAERELVRAKEIATMREYEPLMLRAACVEAGIARRRGEAELPRELLVGGLRRAHTIGGAHLDIQLLRAALDPTADGDAVLPGIRGLVSFLGLSAGPRFELLDRHGRRAVTEADIEREIERRDILVDIATATITVKGGDVLKKRPTVCAVLARLIAAQSQGVDAETLYCDVWGAKEYQPLKHRNTVYVTLNRVRRSMEDLLPGKTVIEKVPAGWRIADEIDAAAVQRIEQDAPHRR
jgi:tetratricopeptide (TPR) repeat protein